MLWERCFFDWKEDTEKLTDRRKERLSFHFFKIDSIAPVMQRD
jgi:hypothetical protein